MKVTFSQNDKRIFIKAVDDFFNVYTHVVTTNDPFVVNFCNGDLSKLSKLLSTYEIVENDEHLILKITEPICLSYKLNKEKQSNENINSLMLGKFQEMSDKIDGLLTRVDDLEDQLDNGVILPGYGVIEKECSELILYGEKGNANYRRQGENFKRTQILIFSDINNKFCSIAVDHQPPFMGNSLKSIKYLTELRRIHFVDLSIEDYSILSHNQKLEEIIFLSCSVKDVSFMGKIKTLKKVCFGGCPNITDISVLSSLPQLSSLHISGCSGIKNKPELRSDVNYSQA